MKRFATRDFFYSPITSQIVNALQNRQPIVISGVTEVIQYRNKLKELIPQLKDLPLSEYTWETGVLKTQQCYFTQVNPLIDQIPVPLSQKEEVSNLQEAFRKNIWVNIPQFEETVKGLHQLLLPYVLKLSDHIDFYMSSFAYSGQHSIKQVIMNSKLHLARSFCYSEEKTDEEMSLLWHYDRQLIACAIKDIFLLNDQVIDRKDGLIYNTANGQLTCQINEDEIKLHCGIPMHILTCGQIPAAAHGVKIEEKGLQRLSHTHFFAPSPDFILNPPTKYELPCVEKGDEELVASKYGLKQNWNQNIDYAHFLQNFSKGLSTLTNQIQKKNNSSSY